MNEAPGKDRARTDSEKQETLMNDRHHPHWPPQVPLHLTLPETNLFYNAEVSAARYPHKPFIIFYGTAITFAGFKDEAERIAGFLQQECQVKAGEQVIPEFSHAAECNSGSPEVRIPFSPSQAPVGP